MAGGIVGRLQAFLGLNTANFEGGIRRSERDVQRFGQTVKTSLAGATAMASGFGKTFAAGVAGGLVTAAFAGLSSNIDETLRGIAQIGDQAKRAGVGLEEFQEWGFVAKQNRIEIDAVVDGFKELQLRADEFVMTGSGSAAEAFKRLGFDASDLSRRLKDPSELMLEIFKRTEDLDSAAQIRVFDELLGGEGGERFVELLSQGENKIRDTMARARELGVVLDESAIAKAAELNRKFSDLQELIGSKLRQAIVEFAEDITDPVIISFGDSELTLNELLDLAGRLKDQVSAIGREEDAAQSFRDLQYEVAVATEDMRALAFAAGEIDGAAEMERLADQMDDASRAFKAGTIDGKAFADRIAELKPKADEATTALDDVDGVEFGNVVGSLGTLGEALLKIIGLGKQASAAMPGSDEPTGEQFGPVQEVWRNPDVDLPDRAQERPNRPDFAATENWLYGIEDSSKGKGSGGSKKDKKDEFASSVAAIKEETAALEAEAVALLAVSGAQQDYGDVVDYARRRAELMYAAQKDGMEITPELKAQIDTLARSYTTAGMNAEDAADRLRRIEEAGERGADAITDIFLSLRNGADGFKDALANLLLQIAQIQIQKSILGGLYAMGGAGGWVGKLGSWLSPPGNAGGTESWRGGITRVNEIGGEIMDLPNGTRIIPHDISKRMVDQKGQSVGGQSNAFTIDLRGTTGDRELDAKIRAAGAEWMRQVPSYIDNHNARTR